MRVFSLMIIRELLYIKSSVESSCSTLYNHFEPFLSARFTHYLQLLLRGTFTKSLSTQHNGDFLLPQRQIKHGGDTGQGLLKAHTLKKTQSTVGELKDYQIDNIKT